MQLALIEFGQDAEPFDHSFTKPGNASFLAVVRELVRSHQAFEAYSNQNIRQLGLTPSQFDVLATLGNTQGMTMGELAERTLETKGTLTGVIDRLEAKNLVRRVVPAENRRCFIIHLTSEGETLFNQVFPAHIAYLKERFDRLEPTEMELLRVLLKRLRDVF